MDTPNPSSGDEQLDAALLAAFGPDTSTELPRPAVVRREGWNESDSNESSLARPRSSYRLLGEIARGGMGVVWKGHDEVLGRDVAIKVLHREASGRSQALQRFIEEAQITGQLDHPGIVPVHDLGLDSEGRVYFSMRLVRGRDLKQIFDLVRTGEEGWNRTRALGVLLKVCEALSYAHHNGILHRDLKPANVMVGQFGEVYVMDWGLARARGRADLHDLRPNAPGHARPETIHSQVAVQNEASHDAPLRTRDGDVIGTPAYMPPEQALGQLERLGPPSDVYAIGAMLYHLLAGQMPYVAPDARLSHHAVLVRVIAGPPKALLELAPDTPAELGAICERAMARDLSQRYRDVRELAEDLRAYLEQRVVRAYRTGAWAELSSWVRRNRALAGTLAAAVALVAGGTALFVDAKAEAYAALSTRTRERDRLDHRLRARELIARADLLYPTVPATVPALREWMRDAEALAEDAQVHEQDRAALVDGPARPLLDELFTALDDLREMQGDVAARIDRALSSEQRSVIDHHDEWLRAIDRIALSRRYALAQGAPFVFQPQLGLVPLGPSDTTRLEEFLVVDSGDAPQSRDPRNGEWRVDTTTGIILVLLPGAAEFTMGSTDRDIGSGGQACLVSLHPFFIGKHEVTQGQWLRVMGERPSLRSIDRPSTLTEDPSSGLFDVDDRCPVESIDWIDAERFSRRLDLRLPFEAQWEYACRAGSNWAYWMGEGPGSILKQENILDVVDPEVEPALDGFPLIAPVGSMRSNPLGLFDVLGNVSELCRDVFSFEMGPARLRRGDGARDDLEGRDSTRDRFQERTVRGGSYARYPLACKSSDRHAFRVVELNPATGIRVARPLWPCPWCEPGAPMHP